MIVFSNNEQEKLELLDMLFNAVSADQLKEFTESEKVVAILSGKYEKTNLFARLVNEHNFLTMEVSSLKSEIAVMKHDMQVLVRLLLKPNDYNSHSDATALKSKYNIY